MYIPFFERKIGYVILKSIYLKMKENVHILECKKTSFRVQIQHQNARIKLFDSFLTQINMPLSELLVYYKINPCFGWGWSLKIISSLFLGVLLVY